MSEFIEHHWRPNEAQQRSESLRRALAAIREKVKLSNFEVPEPILNSPYDEPWPSAGVPPSTRTADSGIGNIKSSNAPKKRTRPLMAWRDLGIA